MTQCEKILRHLKDKGSITAFDAIVEYNIYRLAARISDLKKAGYAIRSELVAHTNSYGEKSHFSRYYLMSEDDF